MKVVNHESLCIMHRHVSSCEGIDTMRIEYVENKKNRDDSESVISLFSFFISQSESAEQHAACK